MPPRRSRDLLELIANLPGPAQSLLSREVRSAYRTMERLNPLEHLYFHASTMDAAWQAVMKHAPAQQDFGGLLAELRNERDIEFIDGLPLAHSIEDAGVLGAILWLQRQPEYLVTFGNDLAYTRYGIDLVAKHTSTGRLLLCEAKGTTGPWCPAGTYLRHTRRKGRQLSWQWCWASLIEFAFRGPTARLFLTTFREFLRGEADRALVINKTRAHGTGFLVIETRAIGESVVRAVPMLDAAPDRQRWLSWLQQLDSRGGQQRQERLRIIQLLMAESYGIAEAAGGVLPRFRARAGADAWRIVRDAAGISAG